METVNADNSKSNPDETPHLNHTPSQRLFDVEDASTKESIWNWLKRLWPFGRVRAQRPKVTIPEPLEMFMQTAFQGKGVPFDLYDIEDIAARGQYGPLVLKGYLGLVAVQTVVPLVLWTAITWGQPQSFSGGLRDLKDFVVAVSASLTGISGLAGFVIGRYFRERAESN